MFQLSSITESLRPYLEKEQSEQKQPEPTLPGLGSASGSGSVPRFLRQNQQALKPKPKLAFAVKTDKVTLSSTNVFGPPSPSPPSSPQEETKQTPSMATAVSAATSVVNTANHDQPQKMLLDQIRQQTELIKKKIEAAAIASSQGQLPGQQSTISTNAGQPYYGQQAAMPQAGHQTTVVQSHQTYSQTTGYGQLGNYAQQPGSFAQQQTSYGQQQSGYAPEQTNYSQTQQQPSAYGQQPAYTPQTVNQQPMQPSSYSAQYYQQNFHMSVPNSAPPSVSAPRPPAPRGNHYQY